MTSMLTTGLAVIAGATALAPMPYLSHAFHLLKEIAELVQHVKGVRSRMKNLTSCLEILIHGLDEKLNASQRLMPDTEKGVSELEKLLQDVRDTARDFANRSFFSLALMRSDAHSIIHGYHGKVMAAAAALNIDIHLANQGLLISHEDARAHDHLEIMTHMKSLEKNQEKLMEELHEANRNSSSPINPALLHHKIQESPEYHPEREVLKDVLYCMPSVYPVFTFPEPEPAAATNDLSGSAVHTTLAFSDESAIAQQSLGQSSLSQPNLATYISPLSTEPTSMIAGETIIPSPASDGGKAGTSTSGNLNQQLSTWSPPPSYEIHLLDSVRRGYEFNFVRSAARAWDWDAPIEKPLESENHMPIAQIIF